MWSRGAERVFGWSADEVLGRNLGEIIGAPQEREAAASAGEELRRVQAVVGLASSLGLRTVAEGVEDEETVALAREMGVDHAQGYGIGRPGPLADTVYSAA